MLEWNSKRWQRRVRWTSLLYIDYVLSVCMWTDYFFCRERSKPQRGQVVLNELSTLSNSINANCRLGSLNRLSCAWLIKSVMRGGCEWGYNHRTPQYPQLYSHINSSQGTQNCCPFGSSPNYCRNPIKGSNGRSCELTVADEHKCKSKRYTYRR